MKKFLSASILMLLSFSMFGQCLTWLNFDPPSNTFILYDGLGGYTFEPYTNGSGSIENDSVVVENNIDIVSYRNGVEIERTQVTVQTFKDSVVVENGNEVVSYRNSNELNRSVIDLAKDSVVVENGEEIVSYRNGVEIARTNVVIQNDPDIGATIIISNSDNSQNFQTNSTAYEGVNLGLISSNTFVGSVTPITNSAGDTDSAIRINTPGKYLIGWKAEVQGTLNGGRDVNEWKPFINGIELTQPGVFSYVRDANNINQGGAAGFWFVELNANDEVEIRVRREGNDGGIARFLTNSAAFSLIRFM